ncbi:MAG: hypothetical protein V7K97_21060 [Nostoc sp.]|uniref:hypothetical protein n=1 Tax=Nostoc sp. TaxID=1180 RepID=UPI002FFAB986
MSVAAQTYFHSLFTNPVEIADAKIQQQLWQRMHLSEEIDIDAAYLSGICLRCYISHKIAQVCFDLGTKFGSDNGFTREDLLPYILDDEVLLTATTQKPRPVSSYQSLATTVLKTFDPARGSLNTWVSRSVQQHPEIKKFLLQHGVFIITNWALLNDTNLKQVKRILTDMYRLASIEIQQACDLLVSYHAVYREDRIEQRLRGGTLPCQEPTPEQLTRIADDLQTRTGRKLRTEVVLNQLKAIASKLRQYRIAAQGGYVSSVSLDEPDIQPIVEQQQITAEESEQNEFITLYQSQFIASLDEAISQVVNNWMQEMQRKNSAVADSFVSALYLHCQGQSMTQIASQIGLKKQYEVTRLLKLKELRADIRQKFLLILRDRVLDIAQHFANSQRLQTLDQQVESILDEQISTMIQEAESEVKIPIRNQPLRSLLARRLGYYLNSRNTTLC